MASEVLKIFAVRVLLGSVLFFAAVIRPSFTSLVFGLLGLWTQFVPIRSGSRNCRAGTVLLVFVFAFSLALSLAQVVAQSLLVFYSKIRIYADDCSTPNETRFKILTQFGWFRFNNGCLWQWGLSVVGEPFVLVVSLLSLIVWLRPSSPVPSSPGRGLWLHVSDYAALLQLPVVAALAPSLISSVYLVLFAGVGFWWGLYLPIKRRHMNKIKLILIVYSALHLITIYLYQIDVVQQIIEPQSFAARLLGLLTLVRLECVDGWCLDVIKPTQPEQWPYILLAPVLFVMHIFLVFQYKLTRFGILGRDVKVKNGFADDDVFLVSTQLYRESTDESVELSESALHLPTFATATLTRMSASSVPLHQTIANVATSSVNFCLFNCYALGLVTMMLWAIFFHSWLAFVFLLSACAIWTFPNTRKLAFVTSPVVLLYALVLISIDYLYSLYLTEEELPRNGRTYKELGLARWATVPCLKLWLKVALALPFFVTMRLFFRERLVLRVLSHSALPHPSLDKNQLGRILSRYFILIVCVVLLLVGVLGARVRLFFTGYMLFFCLLIITLQISFPAMRRLFFAFWTVLVAYAMLVLLIIYVDQFDSVSDWFKKNTRMSQSVEEDIGLVNYLVDKSKLQYELLEHLARHICFLLAAILQLKFFHVAWLHITDLHIARQQAKLRQTPGARAKKYGGAGKRLSCRRRFVNKCEALFDLVLLLAELHSSKLIALGLILLAVCEVSALNFVIVCAVALMLPFPCLGWIVSVLASVYVSLVIIAKMLFQLHFFLGPTQGTSSAISCGNYTTPISRWAQWAGFEKIRETDTIGNYLKGYILVLVLLACQVILFSYQEYTRTAAGVPTKTPQVAFPEIHREDADESLMKCIKYLVNYFFYKFGIEVCYTVTLLVALVRMDAVALVYLSLLFVLFWLPRPVLSKVWGIYLLVLALALPLQYASCVGFGCLAVSVDVDRYLGVWLYLPNKDADFAPNPLFLIADFFQLLCVSCQMSVFLIEARNPSGEYPGGDNNSILERGHVNRRQQNPTKDFVSNNENETLLDLLKYNLFMNFPFLTLAMVFLAGVLGKSLFSLGYILFAFFFLWRGVDLYLQPLAKIVRTWHLLHLYTVLVVVAKVAVQLVACVYPQKLDALQWDNQTCMCILAKLFSVACLNDRPEHTFECAGTDPPVKSSCSQTENDTPIGYDVACFIFLRIQLRLFTSWYFQHCVVEYKIRRILRSRGAVLINDLLRRETKKAEGLALDSYQDILHKAKHLRNKEREAGLHRVQVKTYEQSKRAADYTWFNYEPEMDDELDASGGALMQQRIHAEHLAPPHDSVEAQTGRETLTTQSSTSLVSTETTEEDPTQEESVEFGRRIFNFVVWLWVHLQSFMKSLERSVDHRTRNYRFIVDVLKMEKEKLRGSIKDKLNSDTSVKDIRRDLRSNLEKEKCEVRAIKSDRDVDRHQQMTEAKWHEKDPVVRIALAVGFLLVSHTDLIIYVLIIAYQTAGSSIISLPLPLLAFFWGTLCSPRPPRIFWIIVIAYVQLIMLFKFFFQFGFIVDLIFQKHLKDNIRTWIGFQPDKMFRAWDVALLIALFFHRYVMRALGLWKGAKHAVLEKTEELSSYHSESEKTASLFGSSSSVQRVPMGVRCLKRLGCFGSFFDRVLHPSVRFERDLYPYMFLVGFVCLLLLVFGFNSLSESRTDVFTGGFSVPLSFIFLLVGSVVVLVIDRAIALGKSIGAKLIFQFLMVLLVHVWIFIVLPFTIDRPTSRNGVAQALYFLMGVYFLLSAWQMRSGYPRCSVGHLLMKGYSLVHMIVFKVFMKVPFLFEIRTMVDWTWTDTCMSLFDYFNMENFYATVYVLKCARKFDEDFPSMRGAKKRKVVKYLVGLPLVVGIIVLVVLPLLIYSLVNLIGVPNLADQVSISIGFENYPPFYQAWHDSGNMSTMSVNEFEDLKKKFENNRTAYAFIDQYTYKRTIRLDFPVTSAVQWPITNDAWQRLRLEATRSGPLALIFKLAVRRPGLTDKDEPEMHAISWRINSFDAPDALAQASVHSFVVNNSFSPFWRVPASGKLVNATSLTSYMAFNCTTPRSKEEGNFDLRVSLTDNGTKVGAVEVIEDCAHSLPPDDSRITVTLFVDKVFPSLIPSVLKKSLIAIYIGVVFVVFNIIRGLLTKTPTDMIMYEMPNPDRLMRLCQDIYLVREAKDFELEADLFAKLIFLFRSPETLIRWSRPRVQ